MKRLLSLLFKTSKQADTPPTIYVAANPISFSLEDVTAADIAESITENPASNIDRPKHVVENHDEFVAIEYEDAAGKLTRRRITIHRTTHENGFFFLNAYCHERHAIRTFRADRVQTFITADGEVIPGAKFLQDQMGIDIGRNGMSEDRKAILLRRIKEQLRDPLTILIGLAKCDGHIHVDELDCIQIYAERQILSRNAPTIFDDIPIIATLDGLCHSIGMMRPRTPTIATAISRLDKMDPAQLEIFMSTVQKVIQADGRVAKEEIDFLQEVRWLCTTDVAQRVEAVSEAMELAAM